MILLNTGVDIEGAKAHYEEFGYSEERTIDNFDELGYIASYEDLMNVFGNDTNNLETNGLRHYINFELAKIGLLPLMLIHILIAIILVINSQMIKRQKDITLIISMKTKNIFSLKLI